MFGFGSAEVLKFTKKSEAELLEVQKAFNRLSEEDERQHQNKLQNIRQSAAAVALQEEKEFFDELLIVRRLLLSSLFLLFGFTFMFSEGLICRSCRLYRYRATCFHGYATRRRNNENASPHQPRRSMGCC